MSVVIFFSIRKKFLRFASIEEMRLPGHLLQLISFLKKLPGVGGKTAERFAFAFLEWPQEEVQRLSASLQGIQDKIPPCTDCGCLTDKGVCSFCHAADRNQAQLCLISSARDAFSIESTCSYKGLYHVIEHLLSPLDHRYATALRLDRIEERIAKHKVVEMIIALDSTLEGDTTALFLKNHFSLSKIKISRLAFGLPVGSSLEYIDEGTLARAISGRQNF